MALAAAGSGRQQKRPESGAREDTLAGSHAPLLREVRGALGSIQRRPTTPRQAAKEMAEVTRGVLSRRDAEGVFTHFSQSALGRLAQMNKRKGSVGGLHLGRSRPGWPFNGSLRTSAERA